MLGSTIFSSEAISQRVKNGLPAKMGVFARFSGTIDSPGFFDHAGARAGAVLPFAARLG
jgi:hypothetical protein